MLLSVTASQLSMQSPTWIVFYRDQVLVQCETAELPNNSWRDFHALHAYAEDVSYLCDFDGKATEYFVLDLGNEIVGLAEHEFVSLRQAMMGTLHEPFGVIGRAWQFVHFYRTHRYCGRCGAVMQRVDWEVAVHCHSCQHRCYPRVSPCIIVAIYNDNEILLAQGRRHKESGFYSTIAGFVESGESLEAAVKREVFEEVGVRVHEPEYFDSQPWPFPHALMVGYTARWRSGEIKIDEKEIAHANWFTFDALPKVPPKFSIAGQLIAHVIQK